MLGCSDAHLLRCSPQKHRLTSTVPSSLETCWCSSSTKTASTIGTYENTIKCYKRREMTSLLFLWNSALTDHHGCSCSVWNPHWQECCWKHEAKHKEAWACTWGSSLASPSSSKSTAKPSLKYSINIVENIIDHRFILLITNCQESLKGNSLVQATVLDWDGHLHKRRRRKMAKKLTQIFLTTILTTNVAQIYPKYAEGIPKIYQR